MCGGDVQGSGCNTKTSNPCLYFYYNPRDKKNFKIEIFLRKSGTNLWLTFGLFLNTEVEAEPPFHRDHTAHNTELVQLFSPRLKTEKVPF
jgi:hypothetical protein